MTSTLPLAPAAVVLPEWPAIGGPVGRATTETIYEELARRRRRAQIAARHAMEDDAGTRG